MKNEQGFTLIEVIVVLSIMVIFSAMLVTTYGQILEKERVLRITADQQLLTAAASQYRYAQSGEQYGVITQEELLQAGYLTARIDPPQKGSVYQIVLQGKDTPTVVLLHHE